jgi:hypothetical protein
LQYLRTAVEKYVYKGSEQYRECLLIGSGKPGSCVLLPESRSHGGRRHYGGQYAVRNWHSDRFPVHDDGAVRV